MVMLIIIIARGIVVKSFAKKKVLEQFGVYAGRIEMRQTTILINENTGEFAENSRFYRHLMHCDRSE